jgi:hypothetical protein
MGARPFMERRIVVRSLNFFLSAFNLLHGRTLTVKLPVYQELEQLLIADGAAANTPPPLHVGGYTIYPEPDPAPGTIQEFSWIERRKDKV